MHGILVQLPLPRHIREASILDAIDPLKDINAFHPENVGLFSQGRPRYLPCTPHGIQQLLHRDGIEVRGPARGDRRPERYRRQAAGPDADEPGMTTGPAGANATVTVCHSLTADLPAVTRQADILIAAIGRPGSSRRTWSNPERW